MLTQTTSFRNLLNLKKKGLCKSNWQLHHVNYFLKKSPFKDKDFGDLNWFQSSIDVDGI